MVYQKCFAAMSAIYINQSISFPALPKKKALVVGVKSFPQFSKNLKQVRIFTGNQQWSASLRWHSGISKLN